MKLLLVDGSNIVMRCAFGGDIVPASAVPMAINMIERLALEIRATHMVVAFDCPNSPSFRRDIYPAYKANRTLDTGPWITAGELAADDRGWRVQMEPGFEADDIIATLAVRATSRCEVVVLSSDSDLLALTAKGVAKVAKPLGGSALKWYDSTTVLADVGVPADLFYDYKAMVGDRGDNVPGVDGIGKKRAVELLDRYGTLEEIITAGSGSACKHSRRVFDSAEAARLSRQLVQLRTDVPIAPIPPARCVLAQEPAYA